MKDTLLLVAGVLIVGLVLVRFGNFFPGNSGHSHQMEIDISEDGLTCTLSGLVSGSGIHTEVITPDGEVASSCQGIVDYPGVSLPDDREVHCGTRGNGILALNSAGQFTVVCKP